MKITGVLPMTTHVCVWVSVDTGLCTLVQGPLPQSPISQLCPRAVVWGQHTPWKQKFEGLGGHVGLARWA